MNRRKFFSLLSLAPIAVALDSVPPLDANGNDAVHIKTDFYPWGERMPPLQVVRAADGRIIGAKKL